MFLVLVGELRAALQEARENGDDAAAHALALRLAKLNRQLSARIDSALSMSDAIEARQQLLTIRTLEAMAARQLVTGESEANGRTRSDRRRATRALIKTLAAFMQDPTEPQWGSRIHRRAGVNLSTIYDVLDRMEEDGWVESWEEDIDPAQEGRPRRQLYRLTAPGARAASELLDRAARDQKKESQPSPRPRITRPGAAAT